MKKILIFAMAAILLNVSTGCKKDNDDERTPGTSSFSAVYDGKTLSFHSHTAFWNGEELLIAGSNVHGGENILVYLNTNKTGTYSFEDGAFANGRVDSINFYTGLLNPIGQVILSRYDTSVKVVSGTFSFDAIDDSNHIHHITNGIFDNIELVIE